MIMDTLVTADAEGDEVLLGVVSQSAAWVDMVYLEIGKVPTVLAAPPIALQHLLVQSSIRFRVEPKPRASWAKRHHEAFRTCSRNSCL